MTTTPPEATPVEVTQADRDAAAEYNDRSAIPATFDEGLAKVLARHRLAATPSLTELANELSWHKPARRAVMASVKLGAWMSAALDDPHVCEAMKADIREWFSAGEPMEMLGQALAQAGEALRHRREATTPIPMLLFCPKCHVQHIDAPDERTPDWENPPHRSHLCHNCGCIWRPADVATEGVQYIATVGKADTWTAQAGEGGAAEEGRGLLRSIEGGAAAKYWFEVGFASAWAEVFIRSGEVEPFPLVDGTIDRAWEISAECYDGDRIADLREAIAAETPLYAHPPAAPERGSSNCPICGVDFPHSHSDQEVAEFKAKRLLDNADHEALLTGGVMQVDRRSAADYIAKYYPLQRHSGPAAILRGEEDGLGIVQAFRDHRLAILSAPGSAAPERGRMLDLLADLEAALILTHEHNPHTSVADFVRGSTEFDRVQKWLHEQEHAALTEQAPRVGVEAYDWRPDDETT